MIYLFFGDVLSNGSLLLFCFSFFSLMSLFFSLFSLVSLFFFVSFNSLSSIPLFALVFLSSSKKQEKQQSCFSCRKKTVDLGQRQQNMKENYLRMRVGGGGGGAKPLRVCCKRSLRNKTQKVFPKSLLCSLCSFDFFEKTCFFSFVFLFSFFFLKNLLVVFSLVHLQKRHKLFTSVVLCFQWFLVLKVDQKSLPLGAKERIFLQK